MILIAESGSTKADWMIYEDGELVERFDTIGLNPYFVSEEDVFREVKKVPQSNRFKQRITHIYFFGSGCSADHLNRKIHFGLKKVFPEASIQIDHDLTAAAYATYDGNPAISCIIGTGSNSCFFDGNKIREEVPSLAYILGDEGSGCYFGKKLLTAYFYKQLPKGLATKFYKQYPELDKNKLNEMVYNRPRPNVFLASFMPFILKHQSSDIINEWIYEGFRLFINNQVLCFPEANEVPIHFVGSIAEILRSQLSNCLQEAGLQLGNVIARPAEPLANYVIDHLHQGGS